MYQSIDKYTLEFNFIIVIFFTINKKVDIFNRHH